MIYILCLLESKIDHLSMGHYALYAECNPDAIYTKGSVIIEDTRVVKLRLPHSDCSAGTITVALLY